MKLARACVYDDDLFSLLENGADLKVTGVFSSGTYLAGENGEEVLLCDENYGEIPFAVSVEGFGRNGHDLGIAAEMKAASGKGILEIPEAQYSVRYEKKEGAKKTPFNLEAFIEAADSVIASDERATVGKTEDAIARIGEKGRQQLIRSVMDGKDPKKALEGLIGLGRGLTPTFDDYVTGFTFTLNYTGAECAALNEAVLSSLEKTNIYSRPYLRAAARKKYFSVLASCLAEDSGK